MVEGGHDSLPVLRFHGYRRARHRRVTFRRRCSLLMICPECRSELCRRFEWSNGAVTIDCPACDHFEAIPPGPEVR